MISFIVDAVIATFVYFGTHTLCSRMWQYLYDICYSFLEFEQDKIPFTNYGYELKVDPNNDCLDFYVQQSQSNLRSSIPKEYQAQWRSVNLYSAVLNMANLYKNRLSPIGETQEPASASNVLDGKHILEVGCGRGGGCMVLHGSCKPASYTGVDLSENAVIRSRRFAANCKTPEMADNIGAMKFTTGNSMCLEKTISPLSQDVVFNVESSHCYPKLPEFFASAYTVLKPGGLFLWADLQSAGDIVKIRQALNRAGLKIRAVHDIGLNVSKSLKNGVLNPINEMYYKNYERQNIGARIVYYLFWRLCAHVAPWMLENNKMTYHAIVCQKVVDQEYLEIQKL